MTDNIKLFLESNAYLIDEDVELFLTHAYEQLTDLETKELVEIIQFANIDLSADIDKFLESFISYNIRRYNEDLVDEFVEDIPPFGKTKYQIHDLVCKMANTLGFDIVTDNEWNDYLKRQT